MLGRMLQKHNVIAWDLDGTLIDGPNSRLFIDYINATPHKEHHIITFRTPETERDFWLEELGSLGVNPDLIRSVQSVPNEQYLAYATSGEYGGTALVWEFFHFKGKAANQIGATVLVDDMPKLVMLGCKRYNIDFIDAGRQMNGRG